MKKLLTLLAFALMAGVAFAQTADVEEEVIYEKNKQSDTDALLAELEALRAEKARKEQTAAVGAEENAGDGAQP